MIMYVSIVLARQKKIFLLFKSIVQIKCIIIKGKKGEKGWDCYQGPVVVGEEGRGDYFSLNLVLRQETL
jgi:hypothetical protein